MKCYYICECGKEFDNPQKFNGHKSHCKKHLLAKGWTEDAIILRKIKNKNQLIKNNINYSEQQNRKRLQKLNKWISEQHKCEHCGKIMTEKYGSGRFCSRACANSRVITEKIKQKIKNAVSINTLSRNVNIYLSNPKYCEICGCELPYSKRNHCVCDKQECLHQMRVNRTTNFIKNNGFHKTVYSQYKFGFYKGFECDSSWELAFLVYNLDNNIVIERNRIGFNYIYNGINRTFFPDFVIDDIYYEIKGIWTDQFTSKVNQFPKNKKLEIIDRKKIKFYLDYCINKYGNDFSEKLYDSDKPNWTQSESYKHYINKDYKKSISYVK